jgi:hypothetical protein
MTTIDWTTLQHAYGAAGDIPELLARARVSPPPVNYRSEPWFMLWSSLYHQDDIYSASYAAVPELVTIAGERRELAPESLFLAASIELRRNQPGAPELPPALKSAYERSLEIAHTLASGIAEHTPDADVKLAIADLVFRGECAQAQAILDGDGDENSP